MGLQSKRFLVKNTTVNPKGQTAIERVGHAVSWRDDKGVEHLVGAKSQGEIVSELTDGLLYLKEEGLVSIKEIKDMSELLEVHAAAGKRTERRGAARKAVVSEAVDIKDPTSPKKVRAVEMGKDEYEQKGGAEHEGAVNPDGDPNFVVRAKRQRGRRLETAEKPLSAKAGDMFNVEG